MIEGTEIADNFERALAFGSLKAAEFLIPVYLTGKDGEGGVASILKTAVDDMLAYNPENTTLTALDNILSEIDGFEIDLKE